MVIHFSILAVILAVSFFYEPGIKSFSVSCVENGEKFRTRMLPWVIVFGYVAFLAAMRSHSNDTSAYINSFNNLEATWKAFQTQIKSANSGKDWAFDAVSILFKMFISKDYHLWLAMYAVIESIAFVYILRRNAVSLLDCCFYFFCSTLYYNYFSMMRQWFAIVILFGSAVFIENRKFFRYLLVCLCVAQFHNSAYLMIPVYFLVQGKAWSAKQMILICVFAIAMVFLNPILGALDSTLAGSTYDYAISAMNSGQGSSIIRVFIAAVPVVLAYLYKEKIETDMINISVNMSLLNLLLNILATVTSGLYIIRFTTYISIYNMILYPYLLNVALNRKNGRLVKVLFYIIYLLFYVYQMKYQGAFDYNSDIIGAF